MGTKGEMGVESITPSIRGCFLEVEMGVESITPGIRGCFSGGRRVLFKVA